MAKKLKITELYLTNGNAYTIGGRPAHFAAGEAVVSAIQANRADNAYNKGLQVPGASYTVKLSDGELRIIPLHAAADVGAKWIDEADLEPAPELPEV